MADASAPDLFGTLVPVVVGGLIGLAGGWLGPSLLERRKEKAEKKKLRAQKFEELVGAVVEHYHWITAKQFLNRRWSRRALQIPSAIAGVGTGTVQRVSEGMERPFDAAA
jgi:hypothetical protein